MAKSTISNDPVREQDKFMLRLPEGMRERIKRSADRQGRSMNAEIVQALEMVFPPEPTLEDVVEKVHRAIDAAKQGEVPYRASLIKALDQFADRVTAGLDFDQDIPTTIPGDYQTASKRVEQWQRLNRARTTGIELDDLRRELANGLLDGVAKDYATWAAQSFQRGDASSALAFLKLSGLKFKQPEESAELIRQALHDSFGDLNKDGDWTDATG